MKTNLAEKLERALCYDKLITPQKIAPALRADIRDVIRQYAELANDITLEIQECKQGYNLMLVANIIRFKQ